MAPTLTTSGSSLLQSGDPRSVHLLNEAKAAKGCCGAQQGVPCACGPKDALKAVEGPSSTPCGPLVGIPGPGLTSDQILPLSEEMERSTHVARVRRGRDAFLQRLQKFPNISLVPGQKWLGIGTNGEGAYLTLRCSAHGDYQVRPNDVGKVGKGSGCVVCRDEALAFGLVDPDVVLPIDPAYWERQLPANRAMVRRARDSFLQRLQNYPRISIPAGQFWLGAGTSGEGSYLTLHCLSHGDYQIRPTNVRTGEQNSGCAGCKYEAGAAATTARYREAALSLIGERFGLLEILDVEMGQYNNASQKGGVTITTFATCRCDGCGREVRVMASNLKRGDTQSCGKCLPRFSNISKLTDPEKGNEPALIYIFHPNDDVFAGVKLGITLKRREKHRLREHGIKAWEWSQEMTWANAYCIEQSLLHIFKNNRPYYQYRINSNDSQMVEELRLQHENGEKEGLVRYYMGGLSEVIEDVSTGVIISRIKKLLRECERFSPARVLKTHLPQLSFPKKLGEVKPITPEIHGRGLVYRDTDGLLQSFKLK